MPSEEQNLSRFNLLVAKYISVLIFIVLGVV